MSSTFLALLREVGALSEILKNTSDWDKLDRCSRLRSQDFDGEIDDAGKGTGNLDVTVQGDLVHAGEIGFNNGDDAGVCYREL